VQQTGESLQKIVTSFTKVENVIQSVGHSIVEQADKIQQVNSAVSAIDTATQESAVLVSETLDSILLVADKTTELKNNVAFFKHEV
jgi:methyl-accepting chemotaxis protein